MPSTLTWAASSKKLCDQIDFIRSLIKTPFDVVYNSKSKAATSIEICHESSPSKKSPELKNQESADD